MVYHSSMMYIQKSFCVRLHVSQRLQLSKMVIELALKEHASGCGCAVFGRSVGQIITHTIGGRGFQFMQTDRQTRLNKGVGDR